MNFSDLTGQRFGRLLVISRASSTQWNCLCDCGKKWPVNGANLKNGRIKSCGCKRKNFLEENSFNGLRFIDLIGQKFDKLLVISRSGKIGSKWVCRCDCGKEIIVNGPGLRKNKKIIKSCGCFSDLSLIGQKFGKLTVISKNKKGWNCACDCGNKIIIKSNLKNRKSCGCLVKFSDSTLSAKNALYYRYKRNAKERKIEFGLNFDEFVKLIQQNCYYCGEKPSQCNKHPDREDFIYTGIDRINSKRGYFSDNVVSSCKDCNYLKWNRNREEFIIWLKKCQNSKNSKVINISKEYSDKLQLKKNFLKYFFRTYKKLCAKKRGYPFGLSFEDFVNLVHGNCYYCGNIPIIRRYKESYDFCNGLDRIDNNRGYEKSNVVPCCHYCNTAKLNLTQEVFLNRIKKCYEYMLSKNLI